MIYFIGQDCLSLGRRRLLALGLGADLLRRSLFCGALDALQVNHFFQLRDAYSDLLICLFQLLLHLAEIAEIQTPYLGLGIDPLCLSPAKSYLCLFLTSAMSLSA